MASKWDKCVSFQLCYPRDAKIIAWLGAMGSRQASSAIRNALNLAAENWMMGSAQTVNAHFQEEKQETDAVDAILAKLDEEFN